MNDLFDDLPSVLYEGQVIQIRRTPQFDKWLSSLRDRVGKFRIADRVDRLAFGHVGDAKSLGDDVYELRLAFSPGYRIYYKWQGDKLVLLLCGGDKDSQSRDIARAKALAKETDDGIENTSL